MKKFLFLLSTAALSTATVPAQAETPSSPANASYLTPYVGMFNVGGSGDTTAQFGLELRANPWDYGLRPGVGFNFDHDGGAYVYGGLFWDVQLMESLFLTPNFVAGAYHEGSSKDLGGAIEFRSGIELSYQFQNMHRVGIAFNHISNASIYDKNPGAETILVNYHLPFGTLINW